MNNKLLKELIDLIAFQPLLEELKLDKQPVEFQSKFIEQIQEKVEDLSILKIRQNLTEEEFENLMNLESEDSFNNFLSQKGLNFDEILQEVILFLRDHLIDYRDGIDEFFKDTKNGI